MKMGLPGGSPKGSINQNILFCVSVDAQQLNIGILCGQQEEAGSIGGQIGHDGASLGHDSTISAASSSANTRFFIKSLLFFDLCVYYNNSAVGM